MEHSCKLCACSHLWQGKPKQTRPRKIGRCQETQGRNSRGRTQVRKRRNLFSATLAYLCATYSLGCHVQYQLLGGQSIIQYIQYTHFCIVWSTNYINKRYLRVAVCFTFAVWCLVLAPRSRWCVDNEPKQRHLFLGLKLS